MSGRTGPELDPAPVAAHEIVRWILREGRLMALGEDPARDPGKPSLFVNELGRRLVAAGLALRRMTIYAATLHPQIHGFGWRWWREGRPMEEVHLAQGLERTEEYFRSPLRETIERGTVVRHRLDDVPNAFPVLEEFRADGCAEYVAMPLNCVANRYFAIAAATDRTGGFSDADMALLEAVRPAIAAIVEIIATRRTAIGLFSIYHGLNVGERVLDGQIQRGDAEPLRAVIMTTDLRDFTGLSERLPSEVVLRLLNDYFEHVASAVHRHGGNVLKFIGDGVLSIFGSDGEHDGPAARAALVAAQEIIASLAADKVDGKTLRAGIGLHLGTVMYGNVGSSDRLDFTAIGPAVNLAFRLEALTKELRRPLLASHAFAEAAGVPLVALGPQPIRGFRDVEEVFGLPEHGPAPSYG